LGLKSMDTDPERTPFFRNAVVVFLSGAARA
jgi:hypothetical protein